MFKIIEKKQLSAGVFYMKVTAPEIARNRKAGQFVIVQVDLDFGERIPLTIADANAEEGWIALVFQAVGASTLKLSLKEAGEELPAVLGPLGNPSKIEKYDRPVLVVGGGFGVAPCYPIVQAHKAIGNKVIMVICARNKDLLIYVDEMKALADEVIIMTDDGSAGRQGVSTVPVKEMCESQCPPAEVIAIGPPIMMKFCAATTKEYGVKTTVSLNTIMIDGRWLPCKCWRRNKVRLCRRSRVRCSHCRLGQHDDAYEVFQATRAGRFPQVQNWPWYRKVGAEKWQLM